MGLLARGLDLNGVATTLTSWHAGFIRRANPPRATATQLQRGATLGRPNDLDQQRQVLDITLALLAQEAPVGLVALNETIEP